MEFNENMNRFQQKALADIMGYIDGDVNDQPVDAYMEKDWSRGDILQYPCRNHIRNWVREEFLNSWRNFGLNYTHTTGGEASNYSARDLVGEDKHGNRYANGGYDAVISQDTDALVDWDNNTYKGPKTSWARVVSSAIVENPSTKETMEGFVLGGNGNFHDTYGFDRGDGTNGGGGEAKTLLGYTTPGANEEPKRHEIDEPDYKFRPSPGLTSIESEDIEPGKNFRKTTVNFTCWSQAQLDYLQPYFFQPGMTMIVEWGWNTYPRDSLLDLSPDGYRKIHRIWNNEKNIVSDAYEADHGPVPPASSEHLRKGLGNYGFAMGLITSFNYSIREDGGYDCTIQISCMSEVGQQIMNQTGAKPNKESNKYLDIKTFINTTLRRSLMGKNDVGATINDGLDPEDQKIMESVTGSGNSINLGAAEQQAVALARGRYFTFNKYNSAKPFMAGKSNSNGGTYITVGYLIDIFNIFFRRVAEEQKTRICEFSCHGNRCVAHPNIKSVDGSVLLIPNSVAPRWNKETYHGSTVSRINADGSEKGGAGFSVLKKGESGAPKTAYQETTQNFIDILKSMNPEGVSSAQTLEQAMKESPRDDLHRILTVKSVSGYNLQHLASLGEDVDKLKENAWEEAEDVVKPFPDFYSDIKEGNTMGYSGRVQDLYVSLDTITESFEHGENASAILLDIMKKVSTAGGNMWKFAIIGHDVNTSSNSILSLVDQNFSGSEPVLKQKNDAWVFPSHRGDSIVREMDLSVEPSSEMASMIVFGNMNKKNGFFAKEDQDLILQGAKNPLENYTKQIENIDDKPKNMEDPEKYIVAASSKYFGIENASESSWPVYPSTDTIKSADGKSDISIGKYDMVYYKDGKPNVLKGGSRQDLLANIEKAKKEKAERTIRTGKNANIEKEKTAYASSSGGGDIKQPRTYQIQVDGDFVNKVGTNIGLEGSTNSKVFDGNLVFEANAGGDDKITKYPDRFPKYLIGKVIDYDDYTGTFTDDVFVESDQLEPEDKKYMIVSASVYPGSDKTEYPYLVHLQELKGQETGLNEGALQTYHATKKRHGKDDFEDKLPDRLKKHIKDNNLSTDYLDKQEILTYHGSNGTDKDGFSKNMSVIRSNIKIHDDSYGTDKNDFEIQIELVDTDSNRMKKFCESDLNPHNNVINNMPLPGVDLSITLDGIEGLRLYDTFNCAGVPVKYFNNGIFAITGVKHTIGDGDWSTTIESHYYPG